MATTSGMLFSGGADQTIRVWKPNQASGAFECAATLRHTQGGHIAAVSALCASGPVLFSGDVQGSIKVGAAGANLPAWGGWTGGMAGGVPLY